MRAKFTNQILLDILCSTCSSTRRHLMYLLLTLSILSIPSARSTASKRPLLVDDLAQELVQLLAGHDDLDVIFQIALRQRRTSRCPECQLEERLELDKRGGPGGFGELRERKVEEVSEERGLREEEVVFQRSMNAEADGDAGK